MICFLQINVGVGRVSQDLMIHTAREQCMDVILVSEWYRNAEEDTGWFSDMTGRTAIVVTSNVAIEEVGQRKIDFQCIKINGIRIYSV